MWLNVGLSKDNFVRYEVYGDQHFLSPELYCTEGEADENLGRTRWDLYHCKTTNQGRSKFLCKSVWNLMELEMKKIIFAVMTTSIAFILTTLVVSLFSKTNQTVRDKCEIFFLVGILSIYSSFLAATWSYDFYQMFLIFGIFFSSVWSIVLCYDLWYVFRFGTTVAEDTKRFKLYCRYGLGSLPFIFSLFIIFALTQKHKKINLEAEFFILVYIFHTIAVCANFYMVGLTGYNIYKISRLDICSTQVWLKELKERWKK